MCCFRHCVEILRKMPLPFQHPLRKSLSCWSFWQRWRDWGIINTISRYGHAKESGDFSLFDFQVNVIIYKNEGNERLPRAIHPMDPPTDQSDSERGGGGKRSTGNGGISKSCETSEMSSTA